MTGIQILQLLALMFGTGMLVQAGALIFWAGRLTQTVRDHERRILKLED